jgi:glycosyltransferase involved in cell wall biosynthesis
MQALSPDVVYVWNMSRLSLGPLGAAQNLGFPLVFDLGDYWLLTGYQVLCAESNHRKREYRLFVHGLKSFNPFEFTHILTHSEVLRQCYVEAGFPANHVSVIPRGLPARVIQDTPPAAAQHSAIELLFAGRLTEAKGVHLAIQTVALLNGELGAELDRSARLNIVGEGDPSYVQRLQNLVESLGLQQAVRFIGKVTQEELFDLYKHHDAVLIPSIWVEPFGRIAIEAMSQGTCVIASERGGPAEIVTHGHDGLLVPAEDPHAMGRAVVELVRDENLRDRIRHAAIATVRQRYVLDRVGDQVEAYLNAALTAHHRNQDRQSVCAF